MEGTQVNNMLKYSENDSKNNSFNIYRANLPELNAAVLAKEIIDNEVDIAILRIPAKYQTDLWKLFNIGYNTIIADCLVEYTFKINRDKVIPEINAAIEYIPATVDNKKDIYKLLEATFSSYSNHYSSNPFLKGDLFFDSYKDWVDSCISENGLSFLIKYEGKNAAFFSGKIENNCFVFGLGGVHSDFEGCGIYLDAARRFPYLAAEKGAKICRTGTQIQNHVVQKQLSLAGWALSYSWITIHINSFLNKCDSGKKIEMDCPDKLDFQWVTAQLSSFFPNNTILSNNTVFYNNGSTKNIFLYISNPICNYRNSNESLVTAKLINSTGDLLAISQIIMNHIG